MTDLLTVDRLAVEFQTMGGPLRAVDGLSFRVRAGSTVAIVGESGSGKSVTAQAILGILPSIARIGAGSIRFDEGRGAPVDLARLDPRSPAFRKLRGDRIAMVFQEPMTSLSPLHTVGAQIGEALRVHRGVSKKEARAAAVEALVKVGFPDPERKVDAYSFELSGGLRQRAMIAMAMICKPALLVADEPTTALDVTVQAEILKLMRDVQREAGTAILMITHDLGIVANMADEVVVVYHGKVVESGSARDLFLGPRHPYLKALLKAVPTFDMAPGERLTPIREIPFDAAAAAARRKSLPSAPAGSPLVSVRDVSKAFTGRKASKRWFGGPQTPETLAVRSVSLDVRRGECLGLVGESGCGKTTLSKMIVRTVDADAGTITFFDGDRSIDVLALEGEERKRFTRRIQYVFQDPFSALDPRMTVLDIVTEPLVIHRIGDAAERRARAIELLRLVGLGEEHLNRYPHSFSGGQRQRIGIARALALDPDLIIFDEPVSALDVSIQAQILNLLKDLKDALGLTYLFISHNLAVVDYIADRIAVMAAGRLVEIAPKQTLFRSPLHPFTRALMDAVPYPDLDRPLDFAAISAGRRSDPAAWDLPFRDDGSTEVSLIEVTDDHFVRASEPPPRHVSGRTPEEEEEIRRCLSTDPKGSDRVVLDFSSGDLTGWSTRRLVGPHSAAVQSEVVRTGRYACRFELRPGDRISQGFRAELRDWYNAPYGREIWYGLSMLIPRDFAPPPGTGVVLVQWHGQARLGEPSGKPPMAIRFRDGALHITGAASSLASDRPDKRPTLHVVENAASGEWLDLVFRVNWSRRGATEVDGYLGGQPLFSYRGPLGYGDQEEGPYLKLGVYASGPIETPLVVYHDNYSRGASFAEVVPSRLHRTLEGTS